MIGARTMTNITLSLLKQCNCSWRSILAIAPNIAMVSRAAEGKGPRRERGRERGSGRGREKERKGEGETLAFISCICHSMLKKINYYFQQCITNKMINQNNNLRHFIMKLSKSYSQTLKIRVEI